MAIDETNEYLSAMNPGCPWRPCLPVPSGDSTTDQGDRQHVTFMYSGIDARGPPAPGQPTIGRWSGFLRGLTPNKRLVNGRF